MVPGLQLSGQLGVAAADPMERGRSLRAPCPHCPFGSDDSLSKQHAYPCRHGCRRSNRRSSIMSPMTEQDQLPSVDSHRTAAPGSQEMSSPGSSTPSAVPAVPWVTDAAAGGRLRPHWLREFPPPGPVLLLSCSLPLHSPILLSRTLLIRCSDALIRRPQCSLRPGCLSPMMDQNKRQPIQPQRGAARWVLKLAV